MFLPVQDWESLWKVSHEWRQVVMTTAKIFLDQVEHDKLPVIQVDVNDFDVILKNLLDTVSYYAQYTQRRSHQVQDIRKLQQEASAFTQPLAKLIHCKIKVEEIQRTIDSEYNYTHFFRPRNSQLYQILNSFLSESQNLIESSPLVKKIKFCADLYPQHATVKRLSEALLEIKGQKNRVEEKPKMEGGEEKPVFSFLLMN